MDKNVIDKLLQAVEDIYPNINFDIVIEDSCIQLLHDSIENEDSDDFLKNICNIAINYLSADEQNCFCVLYDYFNEIDYYRIKRYSIYTTKTIYYECNDYNVFSGCSSNNCYSVDSGVLAA